MKIRLLIDHRNNRTAIGQIAPYLKLLHDVQGLLCPFAPLGHACRYQFSHLLSGDIGCGGLFDFVTTGQAKQANGAQQAYRYFQLHGVHWNQGDWIQQVANRRTKKPAQYA